MLKKLIFEIATFEKTLRQKSFSISIWISLNFQHEKAIYNLSTKNALYRDIQLFDPLMCRNFPTSNMQRLASKYKSHGKRQL